MDLEVIALALSILSTLIAAASAYLSQFKKGRVAVPPIRGYRLEPLNYYVDNESHRGLRVYLTATFMNTGAVPKAVSDLRIKVTGPRGTEKGLLHWELECETLESSNTDGTFASQPTLGPYASISRIYTFLTPRTAAMGGVVSAMEEAGSQDQEHTYKAELQLREGASWETVCTFNLRHDGTNRIETDFDRING